MSNHLLFEYKEVSKRRAQEMGLSLEDIGAVLDALCGDAEYRQLQPDWIPRLGDPDDEPLLQMAVEAKVPFIVTWNVGHLKPAGSVRAKRANWEAFDRVMAKVRDVPPLPGDEK